MAVAGKRKATILDVAREAGVSKSVVSRVLQNSPLVSDQKRKAVEQAIATLNYRPNAAARTVVQERSNSLGVLASDFRNPFVAEVLEGVMRTAADAEFSFVIMGGDPTAEVERRALRKLLEMRVDGLILACPTLETRDIVEAAREVPTSIVARSTTSKEVASVTNHDGTGAAAVVGHLAELGHVDIAHIDGGRVAGARPRRSGYERAMAEHGLADHIRVIPSTCTEEGGRRGTLELLQSDQPLPTAVFVANDLAAMGALEAIDRAGLRVPEDISVVGYDNIWLASIHQLSLTTVDQPKLEMGQIAAEMVLERIADPKSPARHKILKPKLIVRGTTTAPPERRRVRRNA